MYQADIFFNILSQFLKLLSVSVFLVSVQHHLTKMKLICYFLIGMYYVYSFWFYIWFTGKNPTHMYDQTACALCLARGKSSWVLSCCLQAQKSNLRSECCINRLLDSKLHHHGIFIKFQLPRWMKVAFSPRSTTDLDWLV